MTLLAPYRVLDLADERGLVCGQILADLGADVLCIEPPGGSRARRLHPFRKGVPAAGSLYWEAYARNRRSSITLDLEDAAGREALLSFVAEADILIESFAPGYLASLGLSYKELSAANPGLIMTSITPFGQSGPKANWPATDLTVMAASNYLISCGDEDRAPLRIAIPQAFLHAGAEAAVGCLVASHERNRSGLGQHVDVSAQAAAMFCTLSSSLAAAWNDVPNTRMAGGMKLGSIPLRLIFPAKDGHVAISFFFGSAVGPATARLMQWIFEEGECGEDLRDKDWVGLGGLLMTGQEPLDEFLRAQEVVAAFTSRRTKAELFAEARRRKVLLTPVATIKDLMDDPHLKARRFWQGATAESSSPRHPGPFAKFSESPISYRYPAPLHDAASPAPRPNPAPRFDPEQSPRRPPLAGLKVLDFTWVMVGPAATRILADYGATVIKVESSARVDTARTLLPYKDRQPGPERSAVYANYNAGKLGLTLNLAVPEAREIARKLATWADVVTEAFTPAVMARWGLGYDDLRALNPRLIYLSTCLGGATGPYRDVAGFGNLGAALAGFVNVIGWPDRPPAGPAGAYSDYIAPRYIASAVLAALDHRERHGQGQHIDLAQLETAIHFLAPAVLDWEVNRRLATPEGNRSPDMAPHGVFACDGNDRWIALAVEDSRQWLALLDLIDSAATLPTTAPSWNLDDRKAHEDAIERAIEIWTRRHIAEEIQDALIARGIPAHVVSDAADVAADPQLASRGHFVPVEHAELGHVVVENSRFILSDTPAVLRRAGPVYGEHNEFVLRDILGLNADEMADLVASGALQ